MARLRIRSAGPHDREPLGKLKLRASLAWGDHAEALNAMPEARIMPAEHLRHAFVAETAEGILGFATVLPQPGGTPELEDLFVHPDHWRQGVGRRLVEEAGRRVRKLGGSGLHVIANRRALDFYAACGFELLGEVETRLEPALEMHKRL